MRFVPPKAATVRRVAAPYEFKISPLHYPLLLIAFIIGETTPSVSACAEPAPLAGGANKKSVRAITYKKPPLSLRTTEAPERGSTPVYISARKYAPGR